MKRLKVISEPGDLVPLLHLFDTARKRDVFREVATDWCSRSQIEKRYGPEGGDVLDAFEKARIVETKWETVGGQAQKSYRSYYTSFQMAFTIPAAEMGEIIGVASMPREEFEEVERELWELAGPQGAFLRNVSEKLSVPLVRLQCLLKRSARLDLRGHMMFRRTE